jgi:hypothetical protein
MPNILLLRALRQASQTYLQFGTHPALRNPSDQLVPSRREVLANLDGRLSQFVLKVGRHTMELAFR